MSYKSRMARGSMPVNNDQIVCPDEIDEILFKTGACLGPILELIRRNRISLSGTAHEFSMLEPTFGKSGREKRSLKEYVRDRVMHRQPHYLQFCSDEFFTRLDNAPPYTVDMFEMLNYNVKQKNLSIEELQLFYPKIIEICDVIRRFIPQKEIMSTMRDDAIRASIDSRWRTIQDTYFRNLYTSVQSTISEILRPVTSGDRSSPIFKLRDIVRDISQLGEKFQFRNLITRNGHDQHFDWTYQNWLDNLGDLWLRYAECYANMFKEMIDLKNPRITEAPINVAPINVAELREPEIPRQNVPTGNCPSHDKEPIPCETKRDYFNQAKIFHPDKNTGCVDASKIKFQNLGEICANVCSGERCNIMGGKKYKGTKKKGKRKIYKRSKINSKINSKKKKYKKTKTKRIR